MSGLATRLYKGEAGLNVVGRRKVWFSVAAIALLIAILSISFRWFTLGVEFEGGNEFRVPSSVGTLDETQAAFEDAGAEVVSSQELGAVGGGQDQYLIRTDELSSEETTRIKGEVAQALNLPGENAISDDLVSASFGADVTVSALRGLGIFVLLVMVYLILRFEWRMAVAAVASLFLDLTLTAGIYSLIGFEVTPSTVIGFLTILGFALYDVVVVFDKVQENTRGITGSSTQTYTEAANLAVNQTLMRSINTGLVALLPVGGLLFIGAFLLGAGTLKDLSLVLFVGMGIAVYSSIFFATPVLTWLKEMEPRYKSHTQRVLARRAAIASGREAPSVGRTRTARQAATASATPVADGPVVDPELAGSTPKVGSRPTAGKRQQGARGGRPGGRGSGGRSGGSRRR